LTNAGVTRRSTKYSCNCDLDDDHEGPHVCDCEGSWDDDGWVYAWPGVFALDPDFPSLPYFEGSQVPSYGHSWGLLPFSRVDLLCLFGRMLL
jgi:hypothetical protein